VLSGRLILYLLSIK